MKGSFFDKIGYNFIEGKGLLIVLVILFSSGSFILGFFAGKKMSVFDTAHQQAKKAEQPVIEAKAARLAVPTPQTPVPPAVTPQEEQPAGKDIKTYELVKPTDQPQQVEPVRPQTPQPEQPMPEQPKAEQPKTAKAVPPPLPSPEPTKAPSEAKPPAKDVLTPVAIPQTQNNPVPVPKESKSQAKRQQGAKPLPKEQYTTIGGERYYIQLGAFKSLGEAMRLQDELKIKGFESNIIKNPVNDGVTLFKVRLGSNYTKSEAAQLMARLNKKGVRGFMKETQR
ncbi:MAG: SPOR domain-containing protein [Nitrospirae bacterium]|nr:SPOR domain-containing protein [Nitrospirota bacterium]